MIVTFSLNWQFHYLKFVTQMNITQTIRECSLILSTNNQTKIKWKLHRKTRLAVFRYHCSALYFPLDFYIYDIYLCQFIPVCFSLFDWGKFNVFARKNKNVPIFVIPGSSSLRQWSAKCLLLHKCCLY